ncbi:CGNR zinc finger domain-containing protein [Aeromicrobium sp.]|uniref:CGNR zinc finger domain-containing protein n=1 Tax=Aeromicrobium sp. TaxID=1871063 RepID=UPI003D6AA516
MHYQESRGLIVPVQIAGHPALELCNTWAGWDEPSTPRSDFLRTFDHVVVVAELAGLVDSDVADRLMRRTGREPAAALDALDRVRRWRRDLHDVVLGQASAATTARVADTVAGAHAHRRLRLDGRSGAWSLTGTDLDRPLRAFAVAAGDLLTSGDAEHVSACPGEHCGWMFVDHAGRRRWCQMAVCGNRAKARAHAARARR